MSTDKTNCGEGGAALVLQVLRCHRKFGTLAGSAPKCPFGLDQWTLPSGLNCGELQVLMLVAQIPHSPLCIRFANKHYKVMFSLINLSPAALVGHVAEHVLEAHHNLNGV